MFVRSITVELFSASAQDALHAAGADNFKQLPESYILETTDTGKKVQAEKRLAVLFFLMANITK